MSFDVNRAENPGQKRISKIESRLTKAQEDYLRTIYVLSNGQFSVRLTDIAIHRDVSKPSACQIVTTLEEKGFVIRDAKRLISLTAEGAREAKRVMDNFTVISLFLTIKLKISRHTALIDACALEHVMSEETVNALRSSLHLSSL